MRARMSNPAYLVPRAGEAIGALVRALQHDMEQGIVPSAALMLAGIQGAREREGEHRVA